MSRKVEYCCDCCKKQVEDENELVDVNVITVREELCYESKHKEMCIECWKEYTDRMIEVGKDLFDSKSKKEIEKEDIKVVQEDIKIDQERAEYTIVISLDENKINDAIEEFKLVIQELDSRIKRSIEEFKKSIKTTAHKNID